jgi:hypothetical protein
MQNVVYLGKDNPVIIDFTFTGDFAVDGLSNFTDIQVDIGGEQYTLILNPTNVIVSTDTQLRVLIGVDTALSVGAYSIKITGISATYDDGYVLTDCGALSRIKVKNY